jgi:hypothetical protein
MTIKVILTDKECFALAAKVTTILAGAHRKAEQAVDVPCGALAMILAANDLSLEEMRAISAQTLPRQSSNTRASSTTRASSITRRRCNEPRQGRRPLAALSTATPRSGSCTGPGGCRAGQRRAGTMGV